MNQVAFTDNNKKYRYWKELPENKRVMLISSNYSGEDKRIFLKFYDPSLHTIFFWRDATGHKPYCFTKLEYSKQLEKLIENDNKFSVLEIEKKDLIIDKEVKLLKITAPDPLSIGGTSNSIREKITAWEADIKYHENYLYDVKLIPGNYYKRINDDILEDKVSISATVEKALKDLLWDKITDEGKEARNEDYRTYIREWAHLLNP